MKLIIIITLLILLLVGCEFKVDFLDSIEKINKIRKN
jgi:PBP1b-binding outer membrane lipoprotein LpoB